MGTGENSLRGWREVGATLTGAVEGVAGASGDAGQPRVSQFVAGATGVAGATVATEKGSIFC